MNYWLMKSEPEDYSIDDLKKEKTTLWTGVRNYQARNFMMQEMKKGDLVLFYHSNAKPPGVAGLARVSSSQAVADPTQFDKKSKYFEPRASADKVVWECVELTFKKKAAQLISLDEIRQQPKLKKMRLLQKGNRLSILPVEEAEFKLISKLAGL